MDYFIILTLCPPFTVPVEQIYLLHIFACKIYLYFSSTYGQLLCCVSKYSATNFYVPNCLLYNVPRGIDEEVAPPRSNQTVLSVFRPDWERCWNVLVLLAWHSFADCLRWINSAHVKCLYSPCFTAFHALSNRRSGKFGRTSLARRRL